MRVLLLNVAPGFRFFNLEKSVLTKSSYFPPLGLLYVGSVLENNGHKVEIVDFLAEKDPYESLKKSLNNVDAVGISVYTRSYQESEETACKIKEIDSDLPIIIGGPHCIFYPEKSLKEIPSADISVEGDGEAAVNEITSALKGKKELSDVPGIHFRKKKEIKKGKEPAVIDDLDTIAFPARHLVEKYDYGKIKNSYFFKPRFTSMITSRGCPFKCRFCTRYVTGMNVFRKRSVENVVKEIVEIDKKYGSVMIVDDNFLSDTKRVSKIMDKLIENKTNIDLMIEGARIDSASYDLYKKMKKAGVKHLDFGIESGNQDVLDFYNKNITIDQIRKAMNLSKKMKFRTVANFIIGAPIETKEHIENTIDFACSLPIDLVIFSPLAYTQGSDLWMEAVKNGKITEDDGYMVIADSKRGLGNFTTEELQNYCKDAFKKFYLRPDYLVKQFYRCITRGDFRLLRAGMNYL